jgi:hypothetical protein
MEIHLNTSKPLFPLGKTVITPAAQAVLDKAKVEPATLFSRHERGDWSHMPILSVQGNQDAITKGGTILSSFWLVGHGMVWVITEGNRSASTILLPQEY